MNIAQTANAAGCSRITALRKMHFQVKNALIIYI